ncbi:hypothetical protein ACGFYQ_34720 [Streptomyces sp. NPDC048258]|uniref:hypothetical protein n=1 Tax=Streptomyces sp. NPDC048258 TaxID=3365527 RepID=UPI00371903A4
MSEVQTWIGQQKLPSAAFREQHSDVEVDEHLVPDEAIPALTRASDRADLLVLGSRGRGGFHGPA